MTGYIASTRASYYLTTLLLQVVLTEWSYIVPQVRCKAICLYFDRECEFLQGRATVPHSIMHFRSKNRYAIFNVMNIILTRY